MLFRSVDNDMLKVLKAKVSEANQVECLRVIRGDVEIGNADVKAFIEKEQLLAKKKQLEVI